MTEVVDRNETVESAAPANQIEPHVIILFGATGDLAARKLLPGLLHLAMTGMMPDYRIVGSLDQHPDRRGVPPPGPPRRRPVLDGQDLAAAVGELREAAELLLHLGGAGGAGRGGGRRRERDRRRAAAAALPERPPGGRPLRDPAGVRRQAGRAVTGGHGEALRHRPGQRRGAQRHAASGLRRGADLPHRPLPRQGRRSRTSWPSASPTDSSSPSGTGTTSTTCRSTSPRRSGSTTASRSTRRPEPSRTWWSPTSSRSWASWPWSRRRPSPPVRSTRRRTRSSAPCACST